jgi:tetratricopeptide (TPR) repeat protein
MNRVIAAIEAGRCVLAVSGSLLNDADIVLALKERAAGLASVVLSGMAVAPITAVSEFALSRALAAPGGLLVVVHPQGQDNQGLRAIADIIARSPNKPTILVAAQQYNPLQFVGSFPGVPVAHLKVRPKEFVRDLPIPAAQPAPAPVAAESGSKKPKASQGPDAPRFAFVGRDEELAALGELLGSGGPIVVSGPAGIGKTWLVEHALAATSLTRLPDLVLGWGTDFDALVARIAEVCAQVGETGLAKLLKAGGYTPSSLIAQAVASLQAAADTAGQVMVVHDLHIAMGREDDFFRKSRLEMLCEALLTNTYPLRLVFVSRAQPRFHREGASTALRRLEVGGIKGRFFHEIFEAYKAPEFSRDKFGPLSERLGGHPMMARAAAIEVRDRENGLELLDDPKFLKATEGDDLGGLKRLYERKLERCGEEERRTLALIAHFRLAVTGNMLNDMGVSRKARLQLLADGLLDMVGTDKDKKYCVHSLVRQALSLRETSEFDALGHIAQLYGRLAREAQGVARLAFAQECNRNAVLGRAIRERLPLDYPDDDAVLDTVTGMIRSKKPSFELAAQRLREVLGHNPANSDAHLLKLEGMQRTQADKDAIQSAIDDAVEKAAVPEVFQQCTSYYLARRARAKAITTLERGIELLPNESRLRTRISAQLVRQGRRKEAVDHLEAAMALDPMLPDAYGLLGTTRREEGAIDAADQHLREAVRLAPDDATQISRLVDLLLARARVEPERAVAMRDEAKELLDRVLRSERKTPDAHLLLAELLRDEGSDLERAQWLLKKARKLTERVNERGSRLVLEGALQAIRLGQLDEAEHDIRDLVTKEPTNHRVFAALAKLLEARQLLIPAHAEYLRAKERTPQGTLECRLYEQELARLQATIESHLPEFDALAAVAAVQVAPEPVPEHRVIRRRKQDGSEHGESAEAGEPVEGAAPADDDAAPHLDEAADDEG